MVLQDNYIYKKRKELISTTEFNKFIILLKEITKLEISYTSTYCYIIYNPKITNIHNNLEKLKLLTEKDIEYHKILGEILGYFYCDSPANIRQNVCYSISVSFVNKDRTIFYIGILFPIDRFEYVNNKIKEHIKLIKDLFMNNNLDYEITININMDIEIIKN
jgi:hypothetical protein